MNQDLNPIFADLVMMGDEAAKRDGIAEAIPTLTAREVMTRPVPPREDMLGNALIFRRGLSTIVAPPGVGKTRATIQIAADIVAGRDFCGLATAWIEEAGTKRPPRVLLAAGNENSLRRYRDDLEVLQKHYDKAAWGNVLDCLTFHVVDGVDDILTPTSVSRLGVAVSDTKADLIFVDPLGDVVAGDTNTDEAMKASISAICREVWHNSPGAALVLVHHARTGKANIAQAVGWDRGHFGKGSKAWYAASRAVINMAPGDSEDSSKVVFACGKCNDAPAFDTFGAILEGGRYSRDENFDLDSWVADVEGKRAGPKRKITIQGVVDFLSTRPSGMATRAELSAFFGVNKSTVSDLFSKPETASFLREGKMGVISTGKLKPRHQVE